MQEMGIVLYSYIDKSMVDNIMKQMGVPVQEEGVDDDY
jgi:hypothetical protein